MVWAKQICTIGAMRGPAWAREDNLIVFGERKVLARVRMVFELYLNDFRLGF